MKKKLIPSKKIRSLDLDPIIQQLYFDKKKFGWNMRELRQIEELYRQFLFLCLKYPDKNICPTYEIDVFWHQHILNTEKYMRDCNRIFGYFLHHVPSEGTREGKLGKKSGRSRYNLERLVEQTLELVKKEFFDSI